MLDSCPSIDFHSVSSRAGKGVGNIMESLKRTGVCTRSQSARENVGAGGASGGANALGKHSRAGGRSQPDTADACCTLSNGRKLRGDKSASGSGSVAVGGGKRLANGSKVGCEVERAHIDVTLRRCLRVSGFESDPMCAGSRGYLPPSLLIIRFGC